MIDTHVHLWDLDLFTYDWIKVGTPLARTVSEHEVATVLAQHHIDGAIVVEAHHSRAERLWLLEQAARHAWIKGVVVGWDFFSDTDSDLARLARHNALKGVRQQCFVPCEDIDTWASRLAILGTLDLSCDLLGTGAWSQAPQLAEQLPEVRFVVNHLGGAYLTESAFDAWKQQLIRIVPHENVFVKVSGYLTAGGDGVPRDLTRYLHTALSRLGARRLLFGSDYPVCTRYGATYSDVLATLRDGLHDDFAHIMSTMATTARTVYRIGALTG